MTEYKVCKQCNEEKLITEFHRNGKYRKNKCRICIGEYHKNYNIVYKDRKTASSKKYIAKNKQKISEYQKEWRIKNKDIIAKKKKIYESNYRARRRELYLKHKENKSVKFLGKRLRTRLYIALKKNFKNGSAVKDLGCSIEDFKIYLESKFSEGMSWENYGEWHIDHIKPLSLFNLKCREDIKEACHYTNLQPLWAIDNLRKHNNYEA